jgi:flagella basal body P-ring formation protein FlgA
MKLVVLVLVAARAFACSAVDGDWIQGKDLIAASPAFEKLDPDLMIAATPLPGVPRLMDVAELIRLARRNGIESTETITEVCFERATDLLTVEKLAPVLRAALGMDDARIEILDYSRAGVPRGELKFARSGLISAGLWRGQVAYGEARTMPVWAKVRVTVERTWVEAREALPARKAISGAQLVERTGPQFPFGPVALDSIVLAAGREPVRAIRPGEPIFDAWLTVPRVVARGDQVKVVVESGLARVELEGTAETSGRLGELVMVLNPQSGQRFQARVAGIGEVVIKR